VEEVTEEVTRSSLVTNVRIRDFRASDLEAAFELDQVCFEPDIAYTRGQLRFFLSRANASGLVAETADRLAGFAIGHRSGERGHIVTIDVAAKQRRLGVGRVLLTEMVRRLERSGARRIRLEVDLRNVGAIRFYQTMGFRESRRLGGYYGRGLDGLEMVKEPGTGSEGLQ
jgi:ribosomal-protein-alanine N-acetyltransferase